MTESFFADLTPLSNEQRSFDPARFTASPDDWALVVTDIVDSTVHIGNGEHKTVNFVAAMAIAALKNLCAPGLIPFLFGGDGAVVMIPPSKIDEARQTMARVQGLAQRDYGLQLRAGLIQVRELRRQSLDVRVARYEPSPGNNFGLFDGGGVSELELAIKGRGSEQLMQHSSIDRSLDDGGEVDLTGLSCRWNELQSRNGKMVTLIITEAADFASVYQAVQSMAASPGAETRPVKQSSLSISWPPSKFLLEVRARRQNGSLAKSVMVVAFESLFAWMLFASGRSAGGFDPTRYREEMATNTDFCRFDQTLCFVVDCSTDKVSQIRQWLSEQQEQGTLRFGMHVSDTALMTCLVTSPTQNLHVHFVDGGVGGYTQAARSMKQVRNA